MIFPARPLVSRLVQTRKPKLFPRLSAYVRTSPHDHGVLRPILENSVDPWSYIDAGRNNKFHSATNCCRLHRYVDLCCPFWNLPQLRCEQDISSSFFGTAVGSTAATETSIVMQGKEPQAHTICTLIVSSRAAMPHAPNLGSTPPALNTAQ